MARTVLDAGQREALERRLPLFLNERRWFSGKGRRMDGATVLDAIPITDDALLALAQVRYTDGDAEVYALPLRIGRSSGAAAEVVPPADRSPGLYEGLGDPAVGALLLRLIAEERRVPGERGHLTAWRAPALDDALAGAPEPTPRLSAAEQSNSSVVYGDVLVLKLFRRLADGVNPELEVGRELGALGFANVPPLAGALEYVRDRGEPLTLGVLQGFVANLGDGWQSALRAAGHFLRQAGSRAGSPPPGEAPLLRAAAGATPPRIRELLGPFPERMELLGRRTRALHRALAASAHLSFAPEVVTDDDLRAEGERLRRQARGSLQRLREQLGAVAPEVQPLADRALALEPELLRRLDERGDRPWSGLLVRTHGDYHLGQVLDTGSDFVIIDFEGEPSRPVAERRRKASPLRDVAGMLRSFEYASHVALDAAGPAEAPALGPWRAAWCSWSSAAFLRGYLDDDAADAFLPRDPGEIQRLLDRYRLEKVAYELRYELDNRPAWVHVPLRGMLRVLDRPSGRPRREGDAPIRTSAGGAPAGPSMATRGTPGD